MYDTFPSRHTVGVATRVATAPVLVVASDDALVGSVIRAVTGTGSGIEVARSGLDGLRKAAVSGFCGAVVARSLPGPLGSQAVGGWFRRLYSLPVVELTGHEDEVAIRQQLVPRLHHTPAVVPSRPNGLSELTEREWQILWALIDTPSIYGVAEGSRRSAHTVHNQLRSIYRKLGVHSIQELLGLVLRVSWTHRQARNTGLSGLERQVVRHVHFDAQHP